MKKEHSVMATSGVFWVAIKCRGYCNSFEKLQNLSTISKV